MAEALRDRGYATGMVGKWCATAPSRARIYIRAPPTSHAALSFSLRHLGGTADGRGLPTRHGFSTYWGMPITNVQSCRSGHQEYPQPSLFHFVATRTPTNIIFATLGLIALTPWLYRSLARWRTTGALLALGGALPVLWFTATLTLINSRSCFLYANETLIEQPAEIGYLYVEIRTASTSALSVAALC